MVVLMFLIGVISMSLSLSFYALSQVENMPRPVVHTTIVGFVISLSFVVISIGVWLGFIVVP